MCERGLKKKVLSPSIFFSSTPAIIKWPLTWKVGQGHESYLLIDGSISGHINIHNNYIEKIGQGHMGYLFGQKKSKSYNNKNDSLSTYSIRTTNTNRGLVTS